MANQEINIVLRMQDEYTVKMQKVQSQMEKMTASFRTVSRHVSEVSSKMIFLGATITGPFALALRNASKYSFDVQEANDRLSTSLDILSKKIALDILPVFNTFIGKLQNLVDWYGRLPEHTRQNIMQFTFLAGVLLTIVGTVGKVASSLISIGTVISTIGGGIAALMGLGPVVGGIVVAIIAMSAALAVCLAFWDRLRSIVAPFLSAVEVVIHTIVGILLEVNTEIWSMLKGIAAVFEMITEAASKLPGPFKKSLGDISGYFKDLTDKFAAFETQSRSWTNANFSEAWRKFSTGASDTANVIDDLYKKIDELEKRIKSMLQGGSTDQAQPSDSFYKGFKYGLEKTAKELQNFGQIGVQVAQNTANAMTTAFSNLFFNVLTGKFDDLKAVFADLGRALLQIFTDMLARMVVAYMVTGLAALFGKNLKMPSIWELWGFKETKHTGGPIYMHNGGYLAPGEIPIVAKRGEYMVSERGVQSAGLDMLDRINRGEKPGGSVSIIINPIIQAWDAASVMRNKDAILAALAEGIRSNSMIREVIKAYV